MKNRISHMLGLVLALFLSITGFEASAQSETQLTVGNAKGIVGTVTNNAAALRVLAANFEAPASVTDIAIEYSSYERKFYLTGKVNNHVLSGIAIQLHQNGDELYARVGPGVELTCVGDNCSDCRISFESGRPRCKCFSSTSSNFKCDMISKITIGF